MDGYIKILHLYHESLRNIWTGNLNLYIYYLPTIKNCFFAITHHDYARSIVLFHKNLLKLKMIHPEKHKKFKIGCFSLKK